MSTGHELPGSNLLNVEDRRASTQNDTEPGSGVEEELPNVKTMDFISSNPKCPLEIVHESSVFEGSSKGSDDMPAMQFSSDDMPAMHFSKQPLGRLQLPRMEMVSLIIHLKNKGSHLKILLKRTRGLLNKLFQMTLYSLASGELPGADKVSGEVMIEKLLHVTVDGPRRSERLPLLFILQRYALDKVPSPIKVRAERNANGASTSDLSPPSSPKRKRETDHKQDLMDVAFTAVLPAKVSNLPRSHSTF